MFNISSLVFSNGPKESALSLKINIKKILIIIGPNNSGKSTILRDIEKWFNAYKNNLKNKISLRNTLGKIMKTVNRTNIKMKI